MRIALTGTPGTGKTTTASLLPYQVIDINALVRDGLNLGRDPERDCLNADMDGLRCLLDRTVTEEICILDGHFAHHFADWSIVLRLDPSELRERLRARGYPVRKIEENLEAEALDVILVEATEMCSRVDEVDTTGKSPQEVAELVRRIIAGSLSLPPGQVDWLLEFFG
ncbi:MAG: adenylate kinase family protein [Methanothrix sp.]|nr:adenylate kinase family protein [Methanothrix sp.]